MLGKEHPSTLTTMHDLATNYFYLGEYQKAKELNIQVLESRKKVLGNEHPATLLSMNDLAYIYDMNKEHKKAQEIYVDALKKSINLRDEDFPRNLILQNFELNQENVRIEKESK